MKRTLALTAIAMIISSPLSAKTWVLTSTENNIETGNWQMTSQDLAIKDKEFTVEQKLLHGGKQEGSKIITITSKDGLTITLIPTRGMNLLRVEGFNTRMGWDSPVKEVVNPAFINLESRNGVGWLEGFNEMMVRCGFEWTGHPVTTDGQIYTLHGKAGNTPASQVEVEIDEKAPYEIRIRGLVKESTFKKADLQTMTELRYIPGSNSFTLHDVLTNHADYPHDYQIIYHSNFGTPLLEEGARFIAPMTKISPFNDYAKAGLKTWQDFAGPTKDFDEMVFNIEPLADKDHKTIAAVINKAGDKGAAIQFDIRELPVLTLWKNTDTQKQGYVTGIEPGTSYAYPVTIEREQKRVKQLQAGESTIFDLTYTVLHNSEQVKDTEEKIKNIQGDVQIIESDTPIAKE
ncbi:aldose 1-epimerase family protein [Bartonella sp. HY761]|uniref:aldose 1-epimerase family protein n=1 Tax=Bartonella sp. HY761 TaxID=2979330 RepID=UPI0021E24C0A|nr:aldose 1-epimerase family protein [Bartonella sp. HY761]UXN07923.1 aldose 1-epimerase family protein [Bartonella sp. HY761]